MPETQIDLVVLIEARPETASMVREGLTALAAPTHRESGCRKWLLHESGTPATMFVTIEAWASEAALSAHMDSAHVRHAVATLTPLLASPPRFLRVERIA